MKRDNLKTSNVGKSFRSGNFCLCSRFSEQKLEQSLDDCAWGDKSPTTNGPINNLKLGTHAIASLVGHS